MKTIPAIVYSLVVAFTGCSKISDNISQPAATYAQAEESVDATLEAIILPTRRSLAIPESDDFANIPQDPKNPLTAEKVQLGQLLFHETRLGGNPKKPEGIYTYSCATCHHAQAGFQSGLAQALGEGGLGFGITGESRVPSATAADSIDLQDIRTPASLNSAYQEVMLWNGALGATGVNSGTEAVWNNPKFSINFLGFQGLESQAIAGQNVHRLKVDTTWLASNTTYKNLFDLAYPNLSGNERISPTTVGLAIAAFERTILASQAPFQKYLRGDRNAISLDEKLGAQLFFGKANCVSCHFGPALSSMNFYALGMSDLANGVGGAINIKPGGPNTKGRGSFTGIDSDMFKFKVPQLYNLKDVKFLGHGASFTSVEDVIRYINNGIPQNSHVPVSQIAPAFVPLNLTEDEMLKITKFIEVSLYDPNLVRFEPVSVPSGNCVPNNDPRSRKDRGCQ